MIPLLSIQGDAIIDSWHPLLKLLFGLVFGALMLYFWYSCMLSYQRAKRPNFYTVTKQDAERWELPAPAPLTQERVDTPVRVSR